MTQEQQNRIDNLLKEIREKKNQVDLPLIKRHLIRYRSFYLQIRDTLAGVTDYASFREFQRLWRECAGIANLPKELTAFHAYLSLVEQYNAIVIPEMAVENTVGGDGQQQKRYIPILISEEEMTVLQEANLIYTRPFNWKSIYTRLTGEAMRTAVYVHAVAILDPLDIIEMIENGSIKKETVESLPYAVSARDLNCNESSAAQMQKQYHAHLAEIYSHYGKSLPELKTFIEPVNDVSFEERPEKLKYLIRHLQEYTGVQENVIREFPAQEKLLCNGVSLKLERYLSGKEGTSEPAVRVVASIPQDRAFQSITIGNLSRELAIQLDAQAKDATLVAELNEIGLAPVSGAPETLHRPYVKLLLTIAKEPVELEHENNCSVEMDNLFDVEMLK